MSYLHRVHALAIDEPLLRVENPCRVCLDMALIVFSANVSTCRGQ